MLSHLDAFVGQDLGSWIGASLAMRTDEQVSLERTLEERKAELVALERTREQRMVELEGEPLPRLGPSLKPERWRKLCVQLIRPLSGA